MLTIRLKRTSEIFERGKKKVKFLRDISKFQFVGASVPQGELWKVSNIAKGLLSHHWGQLYQEIISQEQKIEPSDLPSLIPTLPNEMITPANFVIVQRVLQLPFELDVTFLSHSEVGVEKKRERSQRTLSCPALGKD